MSFRDKCTPYDRMTYRRSCWAALLIAPFLWTACNRQASQTSPHPEPAAGAAAADDGALHRAAAGGDVERVRSILAQNVDVNGKNSEGNTALHVAAGAGHEVIVRLLLDHGADANASNAENQTPLELVSRTMAEYWDSGRGIPPACVAIAEHLAFAGATVEGRKLTDTMMHRYAFAYSAEEAKRRLENGANVNGRNEQGQTPLHLAAFGGMNDRVLLFLEHGADVRATDTFGETPLHEAAGQGHQDTVRLLLAWGADAKAIDMMGGTPLHHAAEGSTRGLFDSLTGMQEAPPANDFRSTATLLIEAGADVHARDERGDTPLHLSSSGGHRDVSEVLLAHGADINIPNNNGETPLQRAEAGLGFRQEEEARRGRGKILPSELKELDRFKEHVAWMKSSGAVEGQASIDHGKPPQCDESAGAESESLFNVPSADDVERLVAAGANVNARDDDRDTPLHRAAGEGRTDIIRALLSHGARLDADRPSGETPLHAAAEQGRIEAAAELLKAGADPNAKDRSGDAPLHVLIRGRSFWGRVAGDGGAPRDYVGSARVLIEHGAKFDASDAQGRTPLHIAALHGDLELVRLLVEAGANIKVRTASGETPLHLVATGSSDWGGELAAAGPPAYFGDIARFLLEKGAEVNAEDNLKSTPLYLAAVFCDPAVADVLLANGADIQAKSQHGETPLAGAKRGLTGLQGMASFMSADELTERTQCYEKLVKSLEERGAKE